MGIGYAFKKILSGDFEDAFNGVWVSDDLLAAQDAAGNNLQKIIAEDQSKGLINESEALNLYSQLAPNSDSSAYWTSAGGNTPLQEFNQAIEENAANIGQFGSKAINKITGLGFKIIPWQVYVAILILVMIWSYPFWAPFAASLAHKK